MISLIQYNFKLLFSPLKWLCCLLFIILMSISMYAPTYYDFTNICEIYIPLIGIILITDIVLIDKQNDMTEVLYVSNSNLKKTFWFRYFIVGILLTIFILLANGIFYIKMYFNGEPSLNEPITHLQFLIISLFSTLLLGILSMTIANIFSNSYIGYGFSLVYWLYWIVNIKKQSIFNLFPFVATPNEYIYYIVIESGFIIFLLLLNFILVQKSPFFITDKFLKYIFK
ncbi:ABC transporter permease [Clostridium botulinum]|uniref:Membrane protein n=1 Tax=Clostridium botulinum (strain Eklund 17B / Type B) TaxID=935198 RepID=B2TRX1_CLOBB|nr:MULTISPECIES: ABC transporter permease [unclassified Clostridium]ACD21737.1 putative membrane protein [Clostridium botulinum B str. Eklund 17B (NRP)]MBN1052519.1 ABC transporter permease [Clostridium botulinum]MBN1055632.1 ABC transporter permease [Clostridium botulinum]MBY6976864.1 ABC transporter permease [Clostridium botulinum]MBY7002042.1 ABC transporter permease [Clostridium botulinum]